MKFVEVKTAELIGPALDWAVAKAEGLPVFVMSVADQMAQFQPGDFTDYERERLWQIKKPKVRIAEEVSHHSKPCPSYSTDWSQGGPLIDKIGGFELKVWLESTPETKCEAHIHSYEGNWIVFGPTPLIAAMRCLVAAKLGDTVQVPKELLP